jgi:hypothetical protein
METDSSGNTVMISETGMEYTDGLMDQYITENTNRIINMVKVIRGGQMEKNIGESGRITRNVERESYNIREYSRELLLKMANS